MTITNKQALDAYNSVSASYEDNQPIPQGNLDTLIKAINADVQFRDYVMGQAPVSYTTAGAIKFVTSLLPLVDEGDRHALYTIMSGWYYETGDKELAYVSLVQAQLLDPEYSLAKLFDRIYKAGWPAEGLAQMRAELHPKVTKELVTNWELVIA